MSLSIFYCILGGCLQESLYWLQMKARLTPAEFKDSLKSKWSWILSIFIIAVITPILAYVWFQDPALKHTAKDFLLFGAGVPMIMKTGMGASLATESVVKLGSRNWLRRYLGV